MTITQIAILGGVFLVFSLGSYAVLRIFSSRGETRRIALVSEHRVVESDTRESVTIRDLLRRVVSAIGAWSTRDASLDGSPVRIHLLNAGMRGTNAALFYGGVRILLGLGLPITFGLIYWLMRRQPGADFLLPSLVFFAIAGYYLPYIWVRQMIRRRQRDLSEHFPDALDMIRMCVEAGLGLDAAISRVEKEIRISCEPLYEELHLVSLELRAGSSRERAFKNLAMRVGLPDVDALVSMLIQVERFGTSVAESIRIHSDTFRTKRRQRAEEQAAKVPVKLLFPMIFCIFPGLMVVLLGPALIALFRTLKMVGAGG